MAINNCGQQEFDPLLQERQEYSNRILMFHLNINSFQNKFDELKNWEETFLLAQHEMVDDSSSSW